MVCSSQLRQALAQPGTGEFSGPSARRLWVMAPEASMPIPCSRRLCSASPSCHSWLGLKLAGMEICTRGMRLAGSIRESGDQTP
jgi:hypothetical protein